MLSLILAIFECIGSALMRWRHGTTKRGFGEAKTAKCTTQKPIP